MEIPNVSSSVGIIRNGNSTVSYTFVHLVVRILRLIILRQMLLLKYIGSQKMSTSISVQRTTMTPKVANRIGDMI